MTFPIVHPIVFKQNPLIQKLATDENWTLSNVDKLPINAREFLSTGYIYAVRFDQSENPLVTLNELDANPNLQAVNRAYRLKARKNRVIAIDVEPDAPLEMKQQALDMPAHYTELSTNGGVHLLIEVPEDLITDRNRYLFQDISVIKEPLSKEEIAQRHPYYEVMFNDHFITFTKRMHPTKPCVDYNQNPKAKEQLRAFLENLVLLDEKRQQERELAKKYRVEFEKNAITDEKRELIQRFIEMKGIQQGVQKAQEKRCDSFNGDESAYEMSVANTLAYYVLKIHSMSKNTQSFRDLADALGEQELIYTIYLLSKDVLPYRPKHDEDRNGLPWLLYTAQQAYAYVKAKNEERRKRRQR